ncbi:hypothetical protein J437_LFUL005858 [Ladona fulva]|uniref:Glucosamine-6-phosphate deaminase n=1 Tax=Ladona fulva TaxID=123851 RepID=A0A8K0P1P1_LADFU|nr:hypothetical protein J437_LFUL005858 [Ladona fulva]
MRLVILESSEEVAEWAAKYVLKRINDFKPGPDRFFVLGLPTGGTPLGMYKKLIEYHKKGILSFKYVKTFNMDEYVGLPRDHPESYHYYMWNNLFKHIDIDPKNVHILDGNAKDLEKECEQFEKNILESGGVELFVGGKTLMNFIYFFKDMFKGQVVKLRLITHVIVQIFSLALYFGRSGMRISRTKTEYMSKSEEESAAIELEGEILTSIRKFKYLGSIVEREGGLDEEIQHRITCGWMNWRKLSGVLCDRKVSCEIKGKLYKTVVRPALLYSSETWPITKAQERKMEVAEMRMLRQMNGVTRKDRLTTVLKCVQP